ncbi:MAG: PTS system mannose/fructose/sorbose family transporter subunit IID [Myxococcaceae bacterium]|nr:PTS system mannose/fructose/sorbose family transporter subunit IID [Myxococcaceae bacterium]MCA3014511.1 PTS system mannose/fructose/sorbose family transporter subunit IID [Myxococcaceae bacterium]
MGVTLSRWTTWRCFWRSLFLQAGFNTEGLQSLGLVYALSPALLALYPEPEARRAAFRRHLSAFNTHPYVAAAIVGSILFHEARVARGEAPPESVERCKALLMAPLAALGDGFYWRSLRPAAGAVSVALVPLLGAWAVVVYLVAYNLVHLVSRWRLFTAGLEAGEALVPRLKALQVPWWGQRLRVVAAGAAGAAAATLAVTFGAHARGWLEPALDVASLAFGVLVVFLLSRRVSPYALLYAAAALAIALGAAGVV